MRFVAIDKQHNLYDGYRKLIRIDNVELLLLQEAGRVHLVAAKCPHLDWPLLEATIMDEALYCPKHGYAFDLYTGKPANDRAARCAPLARYQVDYQGQLLGVYIND